MRKKKILAKSVHCAMSVHIEEKGCVFFSLFFRENAIQFRTKKVGKL